jgi:prepilin-type processing-associated H-X9-DG protein
MKMARLVWILCGLCVAAGSPCEEASPPKLSEIPFEKMLPEDTIFYLSVPDMKAGIEEMKGTNAYRLLEEINPISMMQGQPEFGRLKELYSAYVEPLTKIFHKRVAFAVKNIPAAPGIPGAILFADVPDAGKEAALRLYLNERIHPLLSRIGVQRLTFAQGQYEVEQLSFARPAPLVVCYTIADGLFVATLGRGTMESLLDGNFPTKTLAESEHLREVRRAVGEVTIYANTAALLESVKPMMPERMDVFLKVTGVDAIKAMGIGGETLGTAFLGRGYVYTGSQPKGFLGLLAKEVPPPKVVNYVPGDSTILYAFSLSDKAELYDEVMGALRETMLSFHGDREWQRLTAGIQRAEQHLGLRIREDLLAPFGSELCVALKVPEVLGFPPIYVLLEVKDAARAQAAIDKLIALLEKGAEASVMRTTQDYKGVRITSLSLMPGGRGHGARLAALPLMMRPAYAVVGDFLVVSVHGNLVKKIVDVHQGEKSLKDNPDFQRVFGKLSPSGTITSYVNMKEIYDFLYGTFSGMAAMQIGPEMVGKLGRISQYLGSAGGRLSWDGKGFLSESFSDSGGAEQILVQLAMMRVSPALFRAREKAHEAACMSNLKQLSIACIMYAQDHNDVLPAKLSDLHPEYLSTTDVFLCPVNRSGKAAKAVADIDRDSDYELKIPGQKLGEIKDPARTIMILEKQPNHRGRRNAAFADGHVEGGVRTGQTEPAPAAPMHKAATGSFLNVLSRFEL